MKITFILPSIGKKKGKKYVKSWKMEPITFAILNKITPGKYDRDFYDDRVELVNYDTDADIIAMSVETYTAKRAYQLASFFKEKGKIIIMGGYHPTQYPEEVSKHADITVIGNAESVWETILNDIETNTYKKQYTGETIIDYGIPDRSIYKHNIKKYMNLGLVEIGRGCYHNCEFCSIHAYYKQTYIHRSVEEIITEIKSLPYKYYFLVDDSIFSDKKFAKELFTEITKLKIHWATQITLDIAKDKELLTLLAKSGCKITLIGFESLLSENLAQMDKSWNERIGDRDQLINRIHKSGIGIYASFMFGFDHDTEQSVKDTLAFAKKHKFMAAAFNHLLLLPNTKTYHKFKEEGKLISDEWWLEEGYSFGSSTFNPNLMTPTELKEACLKAKISFFTFPSMIKRGWKMLTRSRSIHMILLFWYENIVLHFDTTGRHDIPIGENLDELPK